MFTIRLEDTEDASPEIRAMLADISALLGELAAEHGAPAGEAAVTATDDFRAGLERAYDASGWSAFRTRDKFAAQAEEGSPCVAIYGRSDPSRVWVVFDTTRLGLGSAGSGLWPPTVLIARELATVLIRVMAWAADGWPSLGRIGHAEGAGRTARNGVIAMQAELVTSSVVTRLRAAAGCAAVTLTEITGDDPCARLGGALDNVVYPGWPDIIDEFHAALHMDLFEPLVDICEQTDEVLELLGRAEAQARIAGRPGPLEAEFAGHPGTRLYLGPAWTRIMAAVGDPWELPRPDAARVDRALLKEGSHALMEMWQHLGMYVGVGRLGVEYRGRPAR